MIPAAVLPLSRVYRRGIRLAMTDRLAYRGSFFIEFAFQLFPLVTAIMLWKAIYAGAQPGFAPGGFDLAGMISYFILMNLVRVATWVEELQWMLPQWIRRGELNKYLIRPVDFLLMEWHMRIGGLLMNVLLLLVPTGILLFFAERLWGVPVVLPADAWRWPAFLASLFLGFQIGFLVSACIGFLAFWILDTQSLLFAIFPIQILLGGGWGPLEIVNPKIFAVLGRLPWSYQTYFPMRVYLGRVDLAGALWGLGGQLAWIAVLGLLTVTLWKRGLRRYAAVGG